MVRIWDAVAVNRLLVSGVAGVVVTGGLALAGSEVASAGEPDPVLEQRPAPVAPPAPVPVRPLPGLTGPPVDPSRSTGGSSPSGGGGMSLNVIGLDL